MHIPKWLLALIVVVILAVAVVGGLFLSHRRAGLVEIQQSQVLAASPVAKQIGVPQSSTGQGQGLTVLFYYEGFSSSDDALRDIGLLEATLETTEPFASSNILSTRVFTTAGQKCMVVRSAKNLLHCDASLIPEINKLGIQNFKLVILSPLNFVPNATVARGKNSAIYLPAYQGVLTRTELDTFLSRFFLHELGHSLGLRDEYARQRPEEAIIDANSAAAPSSNVAYQAAQPNCALDKTTAQQWWGAYITAKVPGVGLYSGCAGKTAYYYPVQNTLMSDDPQVPTYGRVSEDYIRGALDCFFGAKTTIRYPANYPATVASPTSCAAFTQTYPNFWVE